MDLIEGHGGQFTVEIHMQKPIVAAIATIDDPARVSLPANTPPTLHAAASAEALPRDRPTAPHQPALPTAATGTTDPG
jgi:hypothetical protein